MIRNGWNCCTQVQNIFVIALDDQRVRSENEWKWMSVKGIKMLPQTFPKELTCRDSSLHKIRVSNALNRQPKLLFEVRLS
jgi:hypothetical protein